MHIVCYFPYYFTCLCTFCTTIPTYDYFLYLCYIHVLPLLPIQPERPASVRAHAVKSELSDVEGLGFKLEERQKDILELKRSLKLKVRP